MPHRRPRIGITMGDPAGIGAEVVLKAVAETSVQTACVPVIICDLKHLRHTARALNLACDYPVIHHHANYHATGDEISFEAGTPLIYDLDDTDLASINPANEHDEFAFGIESAEAGRISAQCIAAGVELCMHKVLDGIATAPINKRSWHLAGINFPGHTEYLAHLSGAGEHAMAFIAGNLRIVLLSTHVGLVDALRLVKRERIVRTIELAHRELNKLGIPRPRIVVAALNPHGGEGGLFGAEESTEILPAIEECARDGRVDVTGPASADTIFLRASQGEFDAVIALYHDQAMIPVKCLSFGEAVNVTLGLPFVRTSVDHGTAFDIAGRNTAEHSSMVAAILLAAELAKC